MENSIYEGPIWDRTLVFSFSTGDTAEKQQVIGLNGLLRKIIVKRSGASGAVVTATVAIDDKDGNERFTVADLAESLTSPYSVSEPLTGDVTVGVTPSTNPLSDYTVTVYLWGV